MATLEYHSYITPYGPITIGCNGSAITRVCLGAHTLSGIDEPTAVMNRCATEILEYFSGNRSVFDLDLDIEGTDFQKQVWDAIGMIPYGQTSTPQDVALSIGKPGSYRAVGSAVKENPIAILVPAHRVVLSSGYVSKKDGSAKLRAAFRELEHKHSARWR